MALAELPFRQPTGRATDDGWEEWSSGPVDALLGGALPAYYIQIYDEQMPTARQGQSGYDFGALVLIDGIELVDLGPAAVPTAPCTLPVERATCGPDGACLSDSAPTPQPSAPGSETRRSARTIWPGGPLSSPPSREAERPGSTPPEPRLNVSAQMATASPSRIFGRASTTQAINLLGDGHASIAVPVYHGIAYTPGVCFACRAPLISCRGRAPHPWSSTPRPATQSGSGSLRETSSPESMERASLLGSPPQEGT